MRSLPVLLLLACGPEPKGDSASPPASTGIDECAVYCTSDQGCQLLQCVDDSGHTYFATASGSFRYDCPSEPCFGLPPAETAELEELCGVCSAPLSLAL
jgi:hypothetical protein